MGPLEPLKASFDGGRLPVTLQETRVLFDGEAAPLLSVQATEIFAIVPHDVAAKSNVTVAVENQGVKASAVLEHCYRGARRLRFLRDAGRRHQ